MIFSDQSTLCGKLEDLAMNERIYYFPLHLNTSVILHRNPLFSLNYRLVDYCYNVTLTARNSSVLLEPKYDLECFFKIHLPYGNQIELNLYANFYTKSTASESTIPTNRTMVVVERTDVIDSDDIDYEYVDLAAPKFLTSNGICSGIFVRIDDSSARNWSYCIRDNSRPRRFVFKSTGNSIMVHVSKIVEAEISNASSNESDDDDVTTVLPPSIYFEYNAVPITEIVSLCAFGWIAVHQFCVTAVEMALSWQDAELECKHRGGHLASIKSEREQKLIDTLLMNRSVFNYAFSFRSAAVAVAVQMNFRHIFTVTFSNSFHIFFFPQFCTIFLSFCHGLSSATFRESAAYWVGASDEVSEGDFRWTNGFPYTYSNWFPGWSEHNHYNKQPNDDGTCDSELRVKWLIEILPTQQIICLDFCFFPVAFGHRFEWPRLC